MEHFLCQNDLFLLKRRKIYYIIINMKLKEITLSTTTLGSELIADILEDLGTKGVGIYDKQDFDDLENEGVLWDYVSEDVTNQIDVKVKGYFTLDEVDNALIELKERLAVLKENSPFDLGSLEISFDEVDDEDWLKNWEETQKPVKLGDITICPSWIDIPEDEMTIKIDAGMAFGTGQHETTSMCVELMQKIGMQGISAVDIGTGSGILGICAAKLGASYVDAYDIDELAVETARVNAEKNNVANKMHIDLANLLDKSNKKYDVVLANITADVLIELSASLRNYVIEKGDIVVSGIILKRKPEVRKAFEEKGYIIKEEIVQGEWVALRMAI